MLNEKLIELYKMGDRIGSIYEGKQAFTVVPKDTLFEMAMKNGQGTDESDTVDQWLQYVAWNHGSYTPLTWAHYFAEHANLTKYGRTYPDFARTVKHLARYGALTYDKLLQISEDRNSNGNGCLALVYPLVATVNGSGGVGKGMSRKQVETFTRITHAHPEAVRTCLLLHDMIWGGYVQDRHYDVSLEMVENSTARNALSVAIYCANEETMEQVIDQCLYLGGDTDSTLSLALLLWGIRTEVE